MSVMENSGSELRSKLQNMFNSVIVLLTCLVFLCIVLRAYGASIAKTSSGRYHGAGLAVNIRMGVVDESCGQLNDVVLSEILGPAFNSRYMSIETPLSDDNASKNTQTSAAASKRKVASFPPFYVDNNYALELGDEPAWEVKYAENLLGVPAPAPAPGMKHVQKRAAKNSRPWECEARIKWIDLGTNYFPRFLRTVECTKHDCWYGHYTCQPRSFTVKILRRRNGVCVESDPTRKIGVIGLPGELRELWVWEERAVNFCCDCAAA